MNIRYVIQMRNGDYMKQEWDGSLERVKLRSFDNPLDADLFKSKSITERVLNKILTGNTNLLVLYDDDNPPVRVVEFCIKIIEM